MIVSDQSFWYLWMSKYYQKGVICLFWLIWGRNLKPGETDAKQPNRCVSCFESIKCTHQGIQKFKRRLGETNVCGTENKSISKPTVVGFLQCRDAWVETGRAC